MGGPGNGVSFFGMVLMFFRGGETAGEVAEDKGRTGSAVGRKPRSGRRGSGEEAGGWKAARRQQAAVGRGGDQICNPTTTCIRDGSGAWTLLGRGNSSGKTSATPKCLTCTCEPHRYGGCPQFGYTGTGYLSPMQIQMVSLKPMFCRKAAGLFVLCVRGGAERYEKDQAYEVSAAFFTASR